MINIYNDKECKYNSQGVTHIEMISPESWMIYWSHQEKMAHARSELRASQSQASYPWCAISVLLEPHCGTLQICGQTASPLRPSLSRRKMHLVKIHDLLACSALCLIRRLWVNIAQIKLTIQLFHVIGLNPHSESPLSLDAVPLTKAFVPRSSASLSFLLSQIQWHRSPCL